MAFRLKFTIQVLLLTLIRLVCDGVKVFVVITHTHYRHSKNINNNFQSHSDSIYIHDIDCARAACMYYCLIYKYLLICFEWNWNSVSYYLLKGMNNSECLALVAYICLYIRIYCFHHRLYMFTLKMN